MLCHWLKAEDLEEGAMIIAIPNAGVPLLLAIGKKKTWALPGYRLDIDNDK